MSPSRESGDRGWPSTPNTRPRFSNLGQSEYGPSQFNAQDGQDNYGYGQNCFTLGQNYCADGFNSFCGQYAGPIGGGPRSGVEQHAYRPQSSGPNGRGVRTTFENNVYRPQSSGPNGRGPNGGLTHNFGPIDGFGPNDGIGLPVTNPVSNNVQLNSTTPYVGYEVPWLGDLHASDYSDPSASGSHINSVQNGVSGDGSDSLAPGPAGSTSWYPDSGASNHVCQDDSALRDAVPYSGTSSLLMGDGTPAMISSIGQGSLSTQSRVLRLSNILCVPAIRKNLLSVSQFATDNDVYFEFHPTYYVIKDRVTQKVLLTGHIHNGLYQFSVSDTSVPVMFHSSTTQVKSPTQTADRVVFVMA
ncbi:uncharacterized protein LOC105801392 [Gossypium raimondii]|uniref:uncharacterized protein LOC105801392 n=1 Tax=Gossypium raimondii TaxID=29730 RepID=UPI00063ACB9A|nr:uncharacterized protein LOC105801392 [Gossypium raimondii]